MKIYLEAKDLSVSQMKALAQDWAKELQPARQLILLSGPMGVGKTQFLRWTLEALGIKDMASPTYAVHHEYVTPKVSIDHIDLYRLTDDEDLESTGFWDLFSKEKGLIFVEWADRLPIEHYSKQWPLWNLDFSFGSTSECRNLVIKRL